MLGNQKLSTEVKMALLKEEQGMLVPYGAVDDSALLKARTLLAFLKSINKLEYANMAVSKFVFVGSSFDSSDEMPEVPYVELLKDTKVVAGVFFTPFSPIGEQPAMAFYRADSEVHNMFNNVWLQSSVKWLDKNPADRIALELKYKS